MILRELFYADKDMRDISKDMKYDPSRDDSVVKRKDTRKTRLTLRQINELRKAAELHILEQEKDLELVQVMYKPAPAAAA
jgi:hypothetical protein